MFDLPWPTLLAAGAIVMLGYVVFGLTGFGAGIVALPLLAQIFPLRFAVPMMLVFDLCAGLLLGVGNRRHLGKAELLRLVPWLVAGMAIGWTLLVHVDERWLLLGLGVFVAGYAIWSLLSRVPTSLISPRWAAPTARDVLAPYFEDLGLNYQAGGRLPVGVGEDADGQSLCLVLTHPLWSVSAINYADTLADVYAHYEHLGYRMETRSIFQALRTPWKPIGC